MWPVQWKLGYTRRFYLSILWSKSCLQWISDRSPRLSPSKWNLCARNLVFATLEMKRELEPKCVPQLFLESCLGTGGQLLAFCATNVTLLLLASFVVMLSWRKVKSAEKLFLSKLLSRLTHKACSLRSFPVLLRKFTPSHQYQKPLRTRSSSLSFLKCLMVLKFEPKNSWIFLNATWQLLWE